MITKDKIKAVLLWADRYEVEFGNKEVKPNKLNWINDMMNAPCYLVRSRKTGQVKLGIALYSENKNGICMCRGYRIYENGGCGFAFWPVNSCNRVNYC